MGEDAGGVWILVQVGVLWEKPGHSQPLSVLGIENWQSTADAFF